MNGMNEGKKTTLKLPIGGTREEIENFFTEHSPLFGFHGFQGIGTKDEILGFGSNNNLIEKVIDTLMKELETFDHFGDDTLKRTQKPNTNKEVLRMS